MADLAVAVVVAPEAVVPEAQVASAWLAERALASGPEWAPVSETAQGSARAVDWASVLATGRAQVSATE